MNLEKNHMRLIVIVFAGIFTAFAVIGGSGFLKGNADEDVVFNLDSKEEWLNQASYSGAFTRQSANFENDRLEIRGGIGNFITFKNAVQYMTAPINEDSGSINLDQLEIKGHVGDLEVETAFRVNLWECDTQLMCEERIYKTTYREAGNVNVRENISHISVDNYLFMTAYVGVNSTNRELENQTYIDSIRLTRK